MNSEVEEFYLLIRKFLDIHLPVRRGASSNTVRSYKTSLAQYIDYIVEVVGVPAEQISFRQVTEDTIGGFLDKIEATGCSVSTRNQRLAAIRAFLSFAAQEDIACMAVLAQSQRVPKKKTGNTPVGYLNEEELRSLLAQPDLGVRKGLRDLMILVLLYDTAARASELTGIKLKDLHTKGQCPYVLLRGKGNKTRSVPLMDRTLNALKEYVRVFHQEPLPDNLLFYTVRSGRCAKMSYENVSKLVKKYGRMAERDCLSFPPHFHAHMMRHTRAMHLYQDGVPLSYVKEILGHSNINTTSIYASSDVTMLRKVMEPLDIDLPTVAPVPSWTNNRERLMKMAGLR